VSNWVIIFLVWNSDKGLIYMY